MQNELSFSNGTFPATKWNLLIVFAFALGLVLRLDWGITWVAPLAMLGLLSLLFTLIASWLSARIKRVAFLSSWWAAIGLIALACLVSVVSGPLEPPIN